MLTRDQVNAFRYDNSHGRGHYESYFQRANHPRRPLAFWIRYTMFASRSSPGATVGELWAIFFDGEAGRIVAAKEDIPFSRCSFATRGLDVRIGDAVLDAQGLAGHAQTSQHRIAWSLGYSSPQAPLLLLSEGLYTSRLPKAKALVGAPLAVFRGHLDIDGERIDINSWVGSQNHNWGEKHTDRYAWGQVAGFDNAPEAFFECATASIKLGPLHTPQISPMVLRFLGEEHRLNSLPTALRTRASYDYFTWKLRGASGRTTIEAELHARASDFVALRYRNPPGGAKTCLNTKLAAAKVTLRQKGKSTMVLETKNRAAFEILTDDPAHGVPFAAM